MTTAVAESLSTETLDLETLVELSQRTDTTGVLSIYLDARPGALRTSSIDVKNRVAELARRLGSDAAPERARAVCEAIARLQARRGHGHRRRAPLVRHLGGSCDRDGGSEMTPEPDDHSLHSSLRTASRDRTKRLGRFRSPVDRTTEHRLGPVECLLLALIALGVAITIAMFIINPSG